MAQPPSGQGKGQSGTGSGQRTSTHGATPAARSPTGELPVRRSPALGKLPNARAGVTAFELAGTTNSQSYKKEIETSTFTGEEERTQVDALLGARRQVLPPAEEESTTVGRTFDGNTPPQEVCSRDVWRAIHAPLQSREGRRSAELYTQVINQFAAGHNPRYEPEAPNKPRGHIFVWDVTRAMNAEIPHFLGTRELSLARTCDWVRTEGSTRGWRRADLDAAVEAANQGKPVVAMPRDISDPGIGLVRPGELDADGRPRFAAAGVRRGNDLNCRDAFGVMAVEFFVHE